MKRRDILAAAAALATGSATAGLLSREKSTAQTVNHQADTVAIGAPAISQNRRQFRLVTSWPKDFPGLGQMPEQFAKAVYDLSLGRLDIKVYAAGELVGAGEVFDAVSGGAADMYHSGDYYWQGKSKAFSFFTSVPMGMTSTEITAWIEYGEGQALWDELSGRFNIKPLQCGNTGHQTGGWFKRKVNSLEDFKGLKMRMPGLGGEVIRRLGGAAVRLSGGEIYQSLQSGAIDATEWVGPWNDLAFGFYREAPYYYAPGFHEPGSCMALGINKTIWNSFSPSDQTLITHCARSINNVSTAQYVHENARALNILKNDHNIEPQFFSDEIMREIGRISEDVVQEEGRSDAATTKVFESYLAARNQYREWSEMSDGLYMRAREIALQGR